ncbi:MAG: hypothetical protein FWG40_00835 [Peptococcaceae bacterium]|nr:hypothetical protein [Peptococcaceae bacterium]
MNKLEAMDMIRAMRRIEQICYNNHDAEWRKSEGRRDGCQGCYCSDIDGRCFFMDPSGPLDWGYFLGGEQSEW